MPTTNEPEFEAMSGGCVGILRGTREGSIPTIPGADIEDEVMGVGNGGLSGTVCGPVGRLPPITIDEVPGFGRIPLRIVISDERPNDGDDESTDGDIERDGGEEGDGDEDDKGEYCGVCFNDCKMKL